VLSTRRLNWGEDRVMFFDSQGQMRSMLTSWTSLADRDAFAEVSMGRSWFRTDDLLKLRELLDEALSPRRKDSRGVK
jgi:lipopolysaccharide biosynthesis protein